MIVRFNNQTGEFEVDSAVDDITGDGTTLEVADIEDDELSILLNAAGTGTLTFDFEDADDTVTLLPGSTVVGFTTLAIVGGTVDVTAATLGDSVTVVEVNSGIVLTADQFLGLTELVGSGDVTINVANAAEAAAVAAHFSDVLEARSDAVTVAVDGPEGIAAELEAANELIGAAVPTVVREQLQELVGALEELIAARDDLFEAAEANEILAAALDAIGDPDVDDVVNAVTTAVGDATGALETALNAVDAPELPESETARALGTELAEQAVSDANQALDNARDTLGGVTGLLEALDAESERVALNDALNDANEGAQEIFDQVREFFENRPENDGIADVRAEDEPGAFVPLVTEVLFTDTSGTPEVSGLQLFVVEDGEVRDGADFDRAVISDARGVEELREVTQELVDAQLRLDAAEEQLNEALILAGVTDTDELDVDVGALGLDGGAVTSFDDARDFLADLDAAIVAAQENETTLEGAIATFLELTQLADALEPLVTAANEAGGAFNALIGTFTSIDGTDQVEADADDVHFFAVEEDAAGEVFTIQEFGGATVDVIFLGLLGEDFTLVPIGEDQSIEARLGDDEALEVFFEEDDGDLVLYVETDAAGGGDRGGAAFDNIVTIQLDDFAASDLGTSFLGDGILFAGQPEVA